MEPKKIAIVQFALSHGGAERVGSMLANGFHQQGHQVSIYTDLTEFWCIMWINPEKMMEDEKYREQAQRMAVERSHYYTLENIITKWENLFK